MFKKIVLAGLLVGLIGVLAIGAVIRTMDKTGNVAEARGLGNGRVVAGETAYTAVNSQESRSSGYGAAGGRGRLVEGGIAEPLSNAAVPQDWITYEGIVLQVPEAGVDMIMQTIDGEELVVGTGPGYLETQGIDLEEGEQVQVQGFWEDGEFKAGELTRLSDGQTVTMRDEYGRPAWSGGYGRGIVGTTLGEGLEPGIGLNRGQGGISGQSQSNAPGDRTGTGQAQVEGWLTLEGTAEVATVLEMIVQTTDGQEILVDGRAWRFAQELGFMVAEGDQVRLTGFYENGDFEVGEIQDTTTGQTATLRDENGRPLWAGRGRWNS